IVKDSRPTIRWMRQNGVRFIPAYGQESFMVDGKHRFPYGQVLEASGGGAGLVEALTKSAERHGISIHYNTRAVSLITSPTGITGVRVRQNGQDAQILGRAVVLACGGFEANAEWRARYLGEGWDLAKVRGSRFNMGDGIKMAIEAGALAHGHWSGCHAVAWD